MRDYTETPGSGTPVDPLMFSSNTVEDAQLKAYYDFLTKHSSRLNPKQKADLEMLNVKKQFFEIQQKPTTSLNDADRKFLDRYGMAPASSTSPNAIDRQRDIINASAANMKFVNKVEDIPDYTFIGPKAKFEKVGKENGFKKTENVYRRTDYVTGEVTYYYVQQGSASIADLLPKGNGSGNLSKGTSLKPAKAIKLFQSPDYKAVYTEDIKKIDMLLLESAEFALSNYNYETIDTVPSYTPASTYDEDGALISFGYAEEPSIVSHQTSSGLAEQIYQVYDNSIIDIKNALDESINTSYANFMSYFGYIKPGTTKVQPRMPGYRKDGSPFYDFEINIVDADGVDGYEVYLIQEDDII